MSNPERLRATMKLYEMTRADVAKLLGISVSSVDSWLSPPDGPRYRKMSDNAMLAFRVKLKRSTHRPRKLPKPDTMWDILAKEVMAARKLRKARQ